MNAAKQKLKFEEHLNAIVADFAKECKNHKNVALRLRISSVCLSAIVTVCLGLKFQMSELQATLGNVALALSAVITVVGAYEAFFDPRALWIRETIIYSKLRNLKREFEFWAAGCEGDALDPADAETLNRFKLNLDRILMDSLKNSMKIRGAPEAEKEIKSNSSHSGEDIDTGASI